MDTSTLVAGQAKGKTISNYNGYFRDQRWLTAHNAWNMHPFPNPNQCMTIKELLDYGVRGFALDIYGDDENSLHLQHGHGSPYQVKWEDVRDVLKTWLKDNPREIVILFFESYLKGPTYDGQPCALAGLDASLQKISCYKSGANMQLNAMKNITLLDLTTDNTPDDDNDPTQRLFAFIEHRPDEGKQNLFPEMTDVFSENLYGDGSLDIDTWNNLRQDSTYTGILTFMNHFGDNPTGSEWNRNDPDLIRKHAWDFMFNYQGRYPNFISLDYINWNNDNNGPITAFETLKKETDTVVSGFKWADRNDFDDVDIDMGNAEITSLSVETAKGEGITKINPGRATGVAGVTAIQVVNNPGYGIVNLRYKNGNGDWGAWQTSFEKDSDVSNDNVAIYEVPAGKAFIGCCSRVQNNRGVTDFSIALR